MLYSIKDKLRKETPWAVDGYHDIRGRWKMTVTRRKVFRLTSVNVPIWIDLGGGDTPRNGWLSMDMTSRCDLFWDLRVPLPFPTDSVDRIYSSHLLEHLTFEEGQRLLSECRRVLKSGGEISVCVPDARRFIECYMGTVQIPRDEFGGTDAYFETTSIDAVNYVAYMGGHHKYLFDQDNLIHRLRAAGFDDVAARPFDPDTDLIARRAESVFARGYVSGRGDVNEVNELTLRQSP